MKYIIKVLLSPVCWLRNYKYSKQWDKELNKLMKEHKFTSPTEYDVMLGKRKLWIENYPYACFDDSYNWNIPDTLYTDKRMPSRVTVLKLADKLFEDTGIRLQNRLNTHS